MRQGEFNRQELLWIVIFSAILAECSLDSYLIKVYLPALNTSAISLRILFMFFTSIVMKSHFRSQSFICNNLCVFGLVEDDCDRKTNQVTDLPWWTSAVIHLKDWKCYHRAGIYKSLANNTITSVNNESGTFLSLTLACRQDLDSSIATSYCENNIFLLWEANLLKFTKKKI